MKKILKLRFLLLLLPVGYVAGVVLAVQSDVFTGHLIYAILALMGLAVTVFGYHRYEVSYRRDNPSWHSVAFGMGWTVGLVFAVLALIHVCALVWRVDDPILVYIFEAVFAAAAAIACSVYLNERKKQSERQNT